MLLIEYIFLEYFSDFASLVEGKQIIPLRFMRLQRGLSLITDTDSMAHPIPTISAELGAITVPTESEGSSWISYL